MTHQKTHIDQWYVFKELVFPLEGAAKEYLCAYASTSPDSLHHFDSHKEYESGRSALELLADDVCRYSIMNEGQRPDAAERAEHPEAALAEIRPDFNLPYQARVTSTGDLVRTRVFSESEQLNFLSALRKAYLEMRGSPNRHSVYLEGSMVDFVVDPVVREAAAAQVEDNSGAVLDEETEVFPDGSEVRTEEERMPIGGK